MLNAKTKLRIGDAKIRLSRDKPFFGILLYYMQEIEMPEDSPMQTMGVDEEGNLYISEKFLSELTSDELHAVLCHEVMHLVLEHSKCFGKFRAESEANQILLNIATDIVINNILVEEGFILPKNTYIPSKNSVMVGKYEVKDISKKTSEMIYNELKKNIKMKIKYVFDCHSKLSKSNKRIKEYPNWKERAIQSAIEQKKRGNISSGLERLLNELVAPPKCNWVEILQNIISDTIMSDFSWKIPSKKSTTVYLPGIVKEKQLKIAIAIDSSGSMSNDELKEFISEINWIVKSFNSCVSLYVCDCDVLSEIEFNSDEIDDTKILIKGGGGTDFNPVFKKIEDNGEYPNVLIFFTDLDGEFPKEESSYPTIWISTTKKIAPFGEVIDFN